MAATALNLPFGSLYAFSVFLKPLEALLGVSRGDLALVFALASAGFGTGMLLAPRLFGRAPTALLVLACTLAGTSGAVVAATAGGLFQLALGYGVLFGAGGGAGYILAQQTVNLAVTRRQGLVNGYVVGLYPAGAMIAAPLFGWSIRAIGVRATLGGFAAVLAQPIGRVGEMKPGRAARFDAWAKTLGDHPEVTESVLDAFYQNLYGPGFVYSADRAFVSSCRTPCLVLAGNDEAHPFPISEEVAKLLTNSEFIQEWKTGPALASAKVRIKEFLAKHTPRA